MTYDLSDKTILSFSCSTEQISVACLHQGSIRQQRNLDGKQHSEVILPLIQHVLGSLSSHDIDGIAVDVGPGSFMGIRTAIATAQGLALAINTPIYSTHSLHLLALSTLLNNQPYESGPILTALDARRRQWYFAGWRVNERERSTSLYELKENSVLVVNEPILATPEHLQRFIPQTGDFLIGGKVWSEHGEQCESPFEFKETILRQATNLSDYPDAGVLAIIAQKSKNWHSHHDLKPLYLRDQVAEPPPPLLPV